LQTTELSGLDGLRSGPGGFLRSSVNVCASRNSWKIRHSIWELEATPLFVQGRPAFKQFLERRRPIRDLDTKDPEMAKMVHFLTTHGCVTYDGTREKYALREIKYLVRALTSQWYGIYYSHPFWDKLAHCRASLPQVFAWALRTYHLSRSAGATAARGAVYSPEPQIRATFLKSAIEEYSHCERYYFPVHSTFGLEARWVQRLIPFPSSVAFDHQMSVIAEDDWLAHTTVAFFQEYTAQFRDNACALYDRIETTYGLEGFFEGWKEHIGYDVDQSHANDFEDLFAGSLELPRKDVIRSLEAAGITVEYLAISLDELSTVEDTADLRELRASPDLVGDGARQSSVMSVKDLARLCAESSYIDACRAIEREVYSVISDRRTQIAAVISAALSTPLPDLLLRSLSRCVDQRYLVLLGELIEGSLKDETCVDNRSYYLASERAVINFLRESSVVPKEFVFLLLLASRLVSSVEGLENRTRNRFDEMHLIIERQLASVEFPDDLRARFATLGLQFAELCEAAARWVTKIPGQDVLLSAPPSPVDLLPLQV
jgi:hypothetical protein